MDTAYGRRWIRRIGNCEYAFTCEDLALIRRISFLGYGVLVINEAKSTESLSQTYTRYKTLLNELANDGVNLSKHEINVGFVNSLPEKWLTFSQGLRNANHTQTLDPADIYGSTPISTAFFSNNVIQDFQKKSNDEVDKRSSKEYLRDLDNKSLKFSEPKDLPPKNKGLVAETFNWDEEEVSDEEEVIQVKVLMALADDKLTVRKSHARNGEWSTSHIEKSVSGTVTVSETKQTTPSVPTKVKDTKQESRLNELTKLVQMLINEKVNSDQKTQESNSNIQKAESSKSVDLSKISQDSKPKMYIAIGFSTMICKREDHRTSNHDMYIASLKRSESYKAQPYQYASSSKQILIAKAKPFPPCTHYGFNDHIPNDCRNYPECGIYGRYDHSTLGYNRVIQIRGGVLAESS
ncbi:hypothetical protein Tco_0851795 [Tanacetum coccineum]